MVVYNMKFREWLVTEAVKPKLGKEIKYGKWTYKIIQQSPNKFAYRMYDPDGDELDVYIDDGTENSYDQAVSRAKQFIDDEVAELQGKIDDIKSFKIPHLKYDTNYDNVDWKGEEIVLFPSTGNQWVWSIRQAPTAFDNKYGKSNGKGSKDQVKKDLTLALKNYNKFLNEK